MTYSIVARDPASGAFGVAVQSHFFGVGPVVPWLEPGIGAIATQATVNVSFGPIGLELLRSGRAAPDVIAALVASDTGSAERQIGVVDRDGVAAAHTGERCIPAAGHVVGDGFSVQGNLLRAEACWPAMEDAYRRSEGSPFWERLLLALEAAEAAGGDVRGRQSAAIVVVSGEPVAQAWQGRLLDVRVDDHPNPVPELRRLAEMSEAYRLMGELEVGAADHRPVEERYADARRLAPDAMELVFWRGIELALGGDEEAAQAELQVAFSADPSWREALQHVAEAGLVGDDPALVGRLLASASPG
ncbi:MAG TPA: DUF1028 domain-containing protein [Candidatus Limnocylindria bacterium]|nr:DUF1028 domain-containing protein [Candidatus Limnocylindria bacterium]